MLRHRRRLPGAYGPASGYQPLRVAGAKAGHVVAFARTGGLVVVAPRQVTGLADGWADTTVAIPAGIWTDVLTGAVVRGGEAGLAGLLRRFPVAVLARDAVTAAAARAAGAAGAAGAARAAGDAGQPGEA